MRKYQILDHPADLKIKAFGKTKQEVFLNMLCAMADYQLEQLLDNIEKQSVVQRKIQIKSPDLKQLLVDFLSGALYLTEVNSEIYIDIKFEKFIAGTGRGLSLRGQLIGQKIPNFSSPIKAVTYHDLNFKKIDSQWQAVVLFDI